MIQHFFPDDYVKSINDIDFLTLYNKGYRVILFDIDNTIVPHNAPGDERAKAFFKKVKKMGYKVAAISNNKEPRVKAFCEAVEADDYSFLSKKPSAAAYLKEIKKFNVTEKEAVFIGDQIFTDIMGAKNAGVMAILVEPVLKWKEEPQIVLKRFLEAPILFFYNIYQRRKNENSNCK